MGEDKGEGDVAILFLSYDSIWGMFVAGAVEGKKVSYQMMFFSSKHNEKSSLAFIFFEPDKCQFFLTDSYAVGLII